MRLSNDILKEHYRLKQVKSKVAIFGVVEYSIPKIMGSKLRVLLVDDSADVRQTLSQIIATDLQQNKLPKKCPMLLPLMLKCQEWMV